MKLAKRDSPYEKKLGKLEDCLNKQGIKLRVENHGLILSFKDGKSFLLQYTDSGTEPSCGLPRELDDERLVLLED